MKFVIFFALIALALVQASYAQSFDYEWGSREIGDQLLFTKTVQAPAAVFKKIYREVDYSGSSRITYIKITDQVSHGRGASATLRAGGVGSTVAVFRFQSMRGHEIKSLIEIYGL